METIETLLKSKANELTRSERSISDIILQNYPVSGLGSITALASQAQVSTPTVARFIQKLGFEGFPEFQAQLRDELDQKISGPINKHEKWADSVPVGHIMNRYTDAVMSNIKQTLRDINEDTFGLACELVSDLDRQIFIVGGRMTSILAEHFFLHMQVVRPNVTHMRSNSNAWSHYLLDVKEGDVLVVFDIRRYENSTLRLAQFAAERGAEIILFTDQWRSPVSNIAKISFNSRIDVPSAWDSMLSILLISETVISGVQERDWTTTRQRMESLEDMFDRTKFFRKF